MEQNKLKFMGAIMYHIIDAYDWAKELGHYVYYKENTKKPSKKLLNYVNKDFISKTNLKINKELDILSELSVFEDKKKKHPKKTKANTTVIQQDDGQRNYIKLPDDYKFTGVNPYQDLRKKDTIADNVFKDMVYMRSKFSRETHKMFTYDFSNCTPLSDIP